jgi:hypothetical protein
LEDILAMIARLDDRRRVIRAQAWHQGSFMAIYEEATAMRDELQQLGNELGMLWNDLYGTVTNGH